MRTTIVTGAARGIGQAIAKRFAADGYAVGLLDLDFDGATSAADALCETGHEAIALQADTSDHQAVGHAFALFRERYGPVDVLVNNAGIALFGPPLSLPLEHWERCMSVNLDGYWFVTREALPDLTRQPGGAIVNIASVHAQQVLRGAFPYPVSKHAVLGMTRSLAIEFAQQELRVNAVSPGWVDTPINDEQFARTSDPEAARAHANAVNPGGRMGRPEEIAGVVAFLASEEASFVNGANIVVDGGRSLLFHD